MRNIYIISHGRLIRKDYTICFKNDEKTIYFPVKAISDIHVFGEVRLNKRFLEFISYENINIFFYSKSNHYIGAFNSSRKIRGDSTIQQVKSYIEKDRRLYIAKSIVVASANNMIANLKYYNKNLGLDYISGVIHDIKIKIKRLSKSKKIESVMAYEGRIRQDYYTCFDMIIKNNQFKFEKRSYHPPKNQVNALISLFNTLLYNFIASIIHELKINISIGYLHFSNRRTETLNLDIAEIYKPILVDRFVFKIINKRMIKLDDFESNTLLKKESLKHIVFEFDKILYKTQVLKKSKYTYITLIKKDILQLKKFIFQGEKLNFFRKSDK